MRIPNKKGITTPSRENAGFCAVSLRSVTTVLIGIRTKLLVLKNTKEIISNFVYGGFLPSDLFVTAPFGAVTSFRGIL
jgi:hypothetical protein